MKRALKTSGEPTTRYAYLVVSPSPKDGNHVVINGRNPKEGHYVKIGDQQDYGSRERAYLTHCPGAWFMNLTFNLDKDTPVTFTAGDQTATAEGVEAVSSGQVQTPDAEESEIDQNKRLGKMLQWILFRKQGQLTIVDSNEWYLVRNVQGLKMLYDKCERHKNLTYSTVEGAKEELDKYLLPPFSAASTRNLSGIANDKRFSETVQPLNTQIQINPNGAFVVNTDPTQLTTLDPNKFS